MIFWSSVTDTVPASNTYLRQITVSTLVHRCSKIMLSNAFWGGDRYGVDAVLGVTVTFVSNYEGGTESKQ